MILAPSKQIEEYSRKGCKEVVKKRKSQPY